MDWVSTRDDTVDYIAELSRPSQSDFSPLVSSLLAPLPAVPPAPEWPVPSHARDSRHDLRFEFSLAAGPGFETDSGHEEPAVIRDEDDASSDMRGAVSASEDTSTVTATAHKRQGASHLKSALNPLPGLSSVQHQTQAQQVTLGRERISSEHAGQNGGDHYGQAALQNHNSHHVLTEVKQSERQHKREEDPPSTKSKRRKSQIQETHVTKKENDTISKPGKQGTIQHSTANAMDISTCDTIGAQPSATTVETHGAVPSFALKGGRTHDSSVVVEEKRSNETKVDKSNTASEETPTPSIGNSSKGSNTIIAASTSRPTSPQKPVKAISKKKNAKKATSSSHQGVMSQSASLGTSTPSGGLSHTKMCRDRLNGMFERLRHTLPPAPPGVEVKHKAQVLDYAIMVFKSMIERTSQLEVELAVSSNKATMEWITKLVNRTDSFPSAGIEVMSLFAKRRGWPQAELWIASKRPGVVVTERNLDDSVLLSFCRAVTNETMEGVSLAAFSEESKSMQFKANEGVQGRVWSSMRPEWVTGLSDSKNFRRANLARKYGLKVCLAVPVTITGKIEGIMCFYDVKHRPYDTQCLELAMRLAWALGNAIGGKRARTNVITTCGTSES